MTGSPPGTCRSKFVIRNSTTSHYIKATFPWRRTTKVTTPLPLRHAFGRIRRRSVAMSAITFTPTINAGARDRRLKTVRSVYSRNVGFRFWLSEIFLIRSSFALNSVDKSLCAFCTNVRGVGFVGVNVHGELETRIDPDQHVTEDELAISRYADAHERFVAHAISERIFR